MKNATAKRCLLVLVGSTIAACGPGRVPADAVAAAQPQPAATQPKSDDERALALQAALALTGNGYPTPPVFVKRWNLLTQWAPELQITQFTSQGHENDPRPIVDLDGIDFAGTQTIHLRIGSSGRSVDYVTRREPANPGMTERLDAYTITVDGNHKREIVQLCIWAIRSAKSAITFHSAIQLFGAAVHSVPPGNPANRSAHADAEGITVTLQGGNHASCEVKEANR